MQALPMAPPSEIHYSIPEQVLIHQLPPTVAKIVQLNPKVVLGGSRLFDYDAAQGTIHLSPSFADLLKLLVEIGELDGKALTTKTLYDLNAVLQQPQGPQGGLMRKEGTERWELKDNSTKQQYSHTLQALFQKLGFVTPKILDQEMVVDHCIIFGARAKRMEQRISETLAYLNKNLKVTGHIFLLGANRKLTPPEFEYLKLHLDQLDGEQKTYWTEVFNDPAQATEANAFVFIWKRIVPPEMQHLFEGRIVGIKSTRIGPSYSNDQGHRVTTETSAEDWTTFYRTDKPQTVFAIAEQPYMRMADQLRWTVLSKGKKAPADELMTRINNTIFHFASPVIGSNPLISITLDEIGRSVFLTVDALKYLGSLK